MLHRNSCRAELRGVGLTLVAQRIVLGSEDDGGRQAREVGGLQRRRVDVGAGAGVGGVVVPEPDHRVAREQQLVGGVDVAGGVDVGVGDGVDEHLQGDGRATLGVGPLRDDGREVPTGAVPGHDQRHAGSGQVGQAVGDPAQRGPGVVRRGRVRVLRGQPVVDQHHHGVRPDREGAAERVGLLDVADHPTAAVVVDDHCARGALGDQHPHGERAAVGGGDGLVVHGGDGRAGAVEVTQHRAEAAGLVRGHLVERLRPRLGHLSQEVSCRTVQSHCPPRCGVGRRAPVWPVSPTVGMHPAARHPPSGPTWWTDATSGSAGDAVDRRCPGPDGGRAVVGTRFAAPCVSEQQVHAPGPVGR